MINPLKIKRYANKMAEYGLIKLSSQKILDAYFNKEDDDFNKAKAAYEKIKELEILTSELLK